MSRPSQRRLVQLLPRPATRMPYPHPNSLPVNMWYTPAASASETPILLPRPVPIPQSPASTCPPTMMAWTSAPIPTQLIPNRASLPAQEMVSNALPVQAPVPFGLASPAFLCPSKVHDESRKEFQKTILTQQLKYMKTKFGLEIYNATSLDVHLRIALLRKHDCDELADSLEAADNSPSPP